MKWIITKDFIFEPEHDGKLAVGIRSANYDGTGEELPYTFRLLDDDGEVYYEGKSDDNTTEEAFAPLDDFGEGYAGCAHIQYLNGDTWEYL